nr:MFS transporter [Lottiidibacillus patelloidae]
MIKSTLRAYREMDRNIWIRFIGESINSIAFMMLMPFFALYLSDKVDSLFLVGIIMAVSPVAAVFGSFIGGRFADIYGRKPIMILSMVGNGIVMIGFVFYDSFLAFLILSAFFGLFNSLFHPAASAMVADVTPPEKRTEAFGLLRMGHNIGAAIGPLLGASIIFLSKAVVFIIAGASVFLYSLIVLIFISETLPKVDKEKDKEDDTTEKLPSAIQVLLMDKILLLFILTGVIISMSFSQMEGMLPLHFAIEFPKFSDVQNPFPYLMAFNGLLVVLFQFPISSWVSDKPIGKVMFYGAGLFGLGILAIGYLPRLFSSLDMSFVQVILWLLLVYGIYTFGEMLMSPVQMTFVANLAPENLRGTYMGASGLQWILGGALGPLLAGWLLDINLGIVLFSILGIGCIVAGIVYISLDKLVANRSH